MIERYSTPCPVLIYDKTVQKNLGHATASFTLDVYGHVSEKTKQESAKRMQSYFDKIQA